MAIETHLIAMVHEEFLSLDTRMSRGKVCGNRLWVDVVVATGNLNRIGDVSVVGDSTVFLV